MGYDINLSIPDSAAQRLRNEAQSRCITLNQLITERLTGEVASPLTERPAYAEILRRAQAAVDKPRTKEEIDAYINEMRDEW